MLFEKNAWEKYLFDVKLFFSGPLLIISSLKLSSFVNKDMQKLIMVTLTK